MRIYLSFYICPYNARYVGLAYFWYLDVMSFKLSFFSAEYGGGISFFNGFCRFAVVRRTIGLFFFIICTFFIFCYIWTRARVSIRSISFRILSFGLTIAKMILSEFRSLEAFRGLYY
jgi:hypothetical protein